jgi:hypothetical protein
MAKSKATESCRSNLKTQNDARIAKNQDPLLICVASKQQSNVKNFITAMAVSAISRTQPCSLATSSRLVGECVDTLNLRRLTV